MEQPVLVELARTVPRVLFFGTTGAFSRAPLAALLDAGVRVCGVVAPARQRERLPAARLESPRPGSGSRVPGSLPVIEPAQTPSILSLAVERNLPVQEVESLDDPACLRRLEAARPDLICVACFPRLLPRAVLDLPRYGCWNVHPSLLPRHRGPAPLFWAFRDGDPETGVTIHIMDDGIDSGDILLQEAVSIPEGVRGSELEWTCAEAGGRLLVEAIRRHAAGAQGGQSLDRHPQRLDLGSYESWPTTTDLEVPLTRPASWAYRFIRGVGDWYPLTITVAGRRLRVRDALGYTRAPGAEVSRARTRSPYRSTRDEAWIAMKPGVLHVRVR